MLNYFITVTKDLLVASLVLGLLASFISRNFGRTGKRIYVSGIILGLIGSVVMTVFYNATKIIDKTGGTGSWNLRIFSVSTVALVIFLIFAVKPIIKKTKGAGEVIISAAAALLAFSVLFYALPSVLGYPFNFSLGGESYFSTAFIYRMIGYIFGMLLCLLTAISACKCSSKLGEKEAGFILKGVLIINGIHQIAKALQILHAKRIISGSAVFRIIKFTSNNGDLFIYLIIALAFIMPVILIIKGLNVKEPYENPAQKRKIAAKWRNTRRWAVTHILCLVMVVLVFTVFTAIDNREVELSPVEECELRDDALYIPFTQVEDGHLHRFAYETEEGVIVRFIVIKKPNSTSYGVGLDACDICGETGYYERDGQVVCNLCDVVMNINTIGYKGGCNPIVIDYKVENGYIIVPTYTLIEHESEFK